MFALNVFHILTLLYPNVFQGDKGIKGEAGNAGAPGGPVRF